ncbi:MAG TPA: hypothetical protein DCL61_11160 [Cyanobacteria bacterium UBA12227]|nr:hypothetical protein [Cyanobacteria bacterium UBA12227]
MIMSVISDNYKTIMFHFYKSLVLGIASLIAFGSNIENTKAQTSYTFNATYDASSVLFKSITEDITARSISGLSNDAPFGLTKATGLLYVKTNLSTGAFIFNTNPEAFGLKNQTLGGITLFGEGNNKLFYEINNGTGILNLQTLTSTASNTNIITGGEGLFKDATGMLMGSEVYQIANLLVDPSSPIKGIVKINGTISVAPTQKVPEANTSVTLVGMSLASITFLLRSHRRCLM